MELLPFTLAAGETKRFERAGRYLEIIDAPYAVTIKLTGDQGQQGASMRDALAGFYVEGTFAGFEIYSATAQAVTIMVTDGRGGSRRQPGLVRVVDQGTEKTLAGLQFHGLARRIANATKVGLCGILAGSRSFAVKRLAFNTQSASGLCTLLYGTAAPTDTPTSLPIYNKLLAGANASAVRVSGLCATINPTAGEVPGVQNLESIYLAQNVQQELPLTTPFLIPAGYCLLVTSAAINQDVAMIFDGEEQ